MITLDSNCVIISQLPNFNELINYQILFQYKTKNLINGEFVESSTTEWIDLLNPVSNIKLLYTDLEHA